MQILEVTPENSHVLSDGSHMLLTVTIGGEEYTLVVPARAALTEKPSNGGSMIGRVYEYVRTHQPLGPTATQDIADGVGISRSQAANVLRQLQDQRRVNWKRQGRATVSLSAG